MLLDIVSIFHRGGAVLWTRKLAATAGNPLHALVQDVLLEERKGERSYKFDNYTLKWTFDNELDLVFVAIYLNLSSLAGYIEDLLERIKNDFCSLYKNDIRMQRRITDFDNKFDKILAEFEERSFESKIGGKTKAPRSFQATRKGQEMEDITSKKSKKKRQKAARRQDGGDDEDDDDDDEEEEEVAGQPAAGASPPAEEQRHTAPPAAASASSGAKARDVGGAGVLVNGPDEADQEEEDSPPSPPAPAPLSREASASPVKDRNAILAKLGTRPGAGGRGRAPAPFVKKPSNKAVAAPNASPAKPVKAATKWADQNKVDAKELDMSRKDERTDVDVAAKSQLYRTLDGRVPDDPSQLYESGDEAESGDEEKEEKEDAPQKGGRSIFGFLKTLVSGKTLSKEDLKPVLDNFRLSLIGKNVASDIADKLCESVGSSLEGKNVGTFTTIKSEVKRTMEETLTRILTPKKSVDVLQGVLRAKAEGRPYSIVFVGVNGVGKSTSLAKLCAYFLHKKLKVSIAACDTFRAGAVEQLRTHALCLKVPLYEQGYSSDPAAVAMGAIKEGKKNGDDVVLIDTAGRMQDNEPLMRALSKLININRPDLVLFVGEALVGNDAVDQLTKFNRCLADLSSDDKPRLIDGIILTKFDTIDDKVGAAISMTYTTGQPIMFVGMGQTYGDLKRMNVKLLIKALLK